MAPSFQLEQSSKTNSLTGYEMFKNMSLWGHFRFKPSEMDLIGWWWLTRTGTNRAQKKETQPLKLVQWLNEPMLHYLSRNSLHVKLQDWKVFGVLLWEIGLSPECNMNVKYDQASLKRLKQFFSYGEWVNMSFPLDFMKTKICLHMHTNTCLHTYT